MPQTQAWQSSYIVDSPTAATVRCPAGARQRLLRGLPVIIGGAVLLLSTGCAVPQPRGQGQLERIIEPTTQRGYWRYLPKDYVEAKPQERSRQRWPLVVTFHGMKPFDNAYPQAREWQQEADRYGYIVLAPECRAPDVLRQFPVRRLTDSFKSDEEATLAILRHVFQTTAADREHVCATSWSSGGYLAHYMLNQHPDVFTCIAVRQSNFSETILSEQKVSASREHPILILSTQNDFGGVKRETQRAIDWYEQHDYKNFAWIVIKDLGHERTPDMAAAFFARIAGVEPRMPPSVLTRRQAIAGNPRGLALLSGEAEVRAADQAEAPQARAPQRASERGARYAQSAGPAERPDRRSAVLAPSERGAVARQANPRTRTERPRRTQPRNPVSIRVSTAIGTTPLVLAYAADCPADWRRNGRFVWTLNGEVIGNSTTGQRTITEPGEHTLGLLVQAANGGEHRTHRLIRVLPAIDERPASAASLSR